MDIIITFFRDVLDGPLYIVVVIINLILICAGIGYFAEKSQNKKLEKEKFNDNYVSISNSVMQNNTSINNVNSVVSNNVNNITTPISSTINNGMVIPNNTQVNQNTLQNINTNQNQ